MAAALLLGPFVAAAAPYPPRPTSHGPMRLAQGMKAPADISEDADAAPPAAALPRGASFGAAQVSAGGAALSFPSAALSFPARPR